MKVLILLDVLNGHNGTNKIILNIAKGILAEGNEVFLIAFGSTADSNENLKKNLEGIHYEIIGESLIDKFLFPLYIYTEKKFWYFTGEDITHIGRQLSVSRVLRKMEFRPDEIIFSNVQSLFCLPFLDVKIRLGILIHEPLILSGYGPIIGKVVAFMMGVALRRKAVIVSISEHIADVSDPGLRDHIMVLPPIAFEDIPVATTKQKEVLVDTRWTAARDPIFLLDVMDSMRNTKFYMCGKFTEDKVFIKFLKELKSRGLDKNCEIHNGISQTELDLLYDRCMILMRWSALGESGNSVSVMDAVSHECIPIVDRNLGDSAKILGGEISTDIVVQRNPREFALAAERIMDDQKFYEELRGKVKTLKNKRSWNAYAEDLLRLVGSGNW